MFWTIFWVVVLVILAIPLLWELVDPVVFKRDKNNDSDTPTDA